MSDTAQIPIIEGEVDTGRHRPPFDPDVHTGECDRHFEQHGGGCVCPTECRDLHEIVGDDGNPILPLDHWGLGCPFDVDKTPTGEFLALPSGS